MERERGFSLIELMFVMALMAILTTMGAFAVRQFWFGRSLTGGQDQVATQLRTLQATAVGEGVSTRYYGAWFNTATATRSQWGTVRYDAVANTCTSTGAFTFDAGVVVDQVNFSNTGEGGISVTTPITTCQNLASIPDTADFVFFFSRGTATESTDNLRLNQPRLTGRSEEIRVLGLTARVEKL